MLFLISNRTRKITLLTCFGNFISSSDFKIQQIEQIRTRKKYEKLHLEEVEGKFTFLGVCWLSVFLTCNQESRPPN